ncbi:glutathione S-transferase C-terminal domain-containing protein [Leptothoe sp. ISB3NOV94-8A]|uniref:Glutathione S-transferase family protein n=1 Tax=Adonisia turfae CCMR0081 TaxID=2292702 RepID=A0A6M0RIL3_9CYAN|nr:glutathione S-transferase C-terminal domain-containing protein [Adonisia turfae]MDV3350484.1 glutathione S-transferase C-terminal domain-containing protein [Leptothoe sp. LEGE 181152]NEZ55683.1 glutathione S-transferase family protein [Adonisia turfae CCMR0081]
MALPPSLLIRTAKTIWTTLWRTMMSQMAPSDQGGAYQRPKSEFCDRIPSEHFPPEAQRYRLIVGMGCPWAHRTLIVRALKGLETAIPITVVSPSGNEGCWIFEQPSQTDSLGCRTLPQFYAKVKAGYQGRATVPALWDSHTSTLVNNESAEIIEILNSAFNAWSTQPDLDLYPDKLKTDIDQWNTRIYNTVNNGVYRCGFAQTQTAYASACNELFDTLDTIDQTLAHQRYLCGHQLTLADVRLFTTLIRFDIAYYCLFKCNRHRIAEYEHLSGYVRDIYQLPDIAATCDINAIKRDYFGNLFPLNPGGIIPLGPDLENLNAPHGRGN